MGKIRKINIDAFFTLQAYHKPLRSLGYELFKIWNPSWFQGSRAKKQYFEGWYFKNVSENSEYCWSFIPGISLVGENAHSFIQAINGNTGDTYYFRFPPEEFSFSKNGFEIKIGNNIFSDKGFTLDLDDGKNRFSGSIDISDTVAYRAGLVRPGIMGWYRYVPFMECYHGVVSLNHTITGAIDHNGVKMIFKHGKGYIEKDWGSSMPKAWIWMHSNHFRNSKTSFMLSVARIPWIGKTFTGFLGFFRHQGQTITFSTYTGAKIKQLTVESKSVHISINTKKYHLEIKGKNQNTGALKAPVLGAMNRVIHESINAELEVNVSLKSGETLFSDTGYSAGLELVGDLNILTP